MTCLVFSRDRAMQLQAAIELFYLHCEDVPKIYVLYKVTSLLHQKQYNVLKDKFRDITFLEETDFKAQVIEITSKSRYIFFLCDDAVFVKDFSIAEIAASMEKNQDVISFTLFLGRNTYYCYPKNMEQDIPECEEQGRILKYDWVKADKMLDFGYPMNIGACVFFAGDIIWLMKGIDFKNPNLLEGMLAINARVYAEHKNKRLCYKQSVAFINPINLVQDVCKNRVGNNKKYSAENLALAFDLGWKIDIESYSGFVSDSAIQELELKLK